MKCAGRYRFCHLGVAIGLGVALVTLFLSAVSLTSAQSPVPHDVVFLIDNSPSATGDTDRDGKPDTTPTDEQDVRLRLVRFVINVLGLDPSGEHQRVGVISFARSEPPLTLMPMTSVRDWSKADFAAIREVNQGTGTDFAAAIDAASDMLFPTDDSSCAPDVRHCDIVMVTDGSFEDSGASRSDTISQLEKSLQTISNDVSVHIYTFETDDWPVWGGFREESFVATYYTNVVVNSADQVYAAVLGNLGKEKLLEGLLPVVVDGQNSIDFDVPPFRNWTRCQILPDAPMTVTFLRAGEVIEPLVTGNEYTLFQPQTGEWTVRLQGNGMVYYRQAGEGVADLTLDIQSPYGALFLGDDVLIEASIAAGNTLVTDTQCFTVTASIAGPDLVIDPLTLTRGSGSTFFTSVSTDHFVAGQYIVALMGESSVVDTSIVARDTFTVVTLPTLSMAVEPTGPITPGDSVYVDITVSDWRPGCQLTLHRLTQDRDETIAFTQPGGIYATVLTNVLSETVVLAELNYNLANQSYHTRTLPHSIIVEHNQNIGGVVENRMAWKAIVLLAVVLFVAWIYKLLKRSGKTSLDKPDTWRKLNSQILENNWTEIKRLGERLALEWRTEYYHHLEKFSELSGNYALQSVLNNHDALANDLEEENQVVIAVLVYAGWLVSCYPGRVSLDEGELGPIPPWTVLEGAELNEPTNEMGKRRYTVGDALRLTQSWRMFLRVWEKLEKNLNESNRPVEDWTSGGDPVEVWKSYSQLVKCALERREEVHKSEPLPDKGSIFEFLPDGELKGKVDSIFSGTASREDFERHPVLQMFIPKKEEKENTT